MFFEYFVVTLVPPTPSPFPPPVEQGLLNPGLSSAGLGIFWLFVRLLARPLPSLRSQVLIIRPFIHSLFLPLPFALCQLSAGSSLLLCTCRNPQPPRLCSQPAVSPPASESHILMSVPLTQTVISFLILWALWPCNWVIPSCIDLHVNIKWVASQVVLVVKKPPAKES